MAGADSALTLRPAAADDRDRLLEWANDGETRAASFRTGAIDEATHEVWFAARLAAEDGRIWIGVVAGRPIGQVRIDGVGGDRGEVSIGIAPEARGRGFARSLLEAGIEAAGQELRVTTFVAAVRPDNARSLALFRGAGFAHEATGLRAGVACIVLERRASPADG